MLEYLWYSFCILHDAKCENAAHTVYHIVTETVFRIRKIHLMDPDPRIRNPEILIRIRKAL
jgi:hypothetical protein